MSKAKLNESVVENELRKSSPFFKKDPQETATPKQPQAVTSQPQVPEPAKPAQADPSTDVPISRPTDRSVMSVQILQTKRQTVRRAFEFYMDQLESLEKLSLEERL